MFEIFKSKRLLSANEELAMVTEGDHKKIMKYLASGNPLSLAAIVHIVRRGNVEEVALCMKNKTEFGAEALLTLIELGNHELIMDSLSYCSWAHPYYCSNLQIALIERGNSEEILKLVRRYPLKDEAVHVLIASNYKEAVEAYLLRNRLYSPMVQLGVIKLGLQDRIREMLHQRVQLSSEAQLALVERGEHEEIMEYVNLYSLEEQAENALFTRRNQEELLAYFAHTSLYDSTAKMLLEDMASTHDETLVRAYIKEGNVFETDDDVFLVQNASKDLLLLYFETSDILSENLLPYLVELDDDGLIMSYLVNANRCGCNFDGNDEQLLLQRDNMQEIVYYMRHFAFDQESLSEYFMTCSHEKVMAYIEQGPLGEEAEVALINRRNTKEVRAYLSKYMKEVMSSNIVCSYLISMLDLEQLALKPFPEEN